MRSFLIILGSIVVIGAAFFVYLWTEAGNITARTAQSNRPIVPATKPIDAPDATRMIGSGSAPWMRALDERTGEISQEFRAAKFDPQRDGTVKVTSPEARFYLGRGDSRQLLVMRGKHGRVVVPDLGNRSPQNIRTTAEMPTSGEIQDVTIELYNHLSDTVPSLVCTMNNASFDNDTLRIYTESFEENGKLIAGDQVPVKVRGVDYDFDGRGLDIHWNERDRRLQSLEIAHGQRLVVKHPNAIQRVNAPTSQPVTLQTSSSTVWAEGLLASADPSAAGEAIRPPRTRRPLTSEPASAAAGDQAPSIAPIKIPHDKSEPVYRASFHDHVRVLQGSDDIANADLMHVDFLMN